MASLKSPKGTTIPVTIVDNNDGTYAASYVPETSGPSTLNVECHTKAYGILFIFYFNPKPSYDYRSWSN